MEPIIRRIAIIAPPTLGHLNPLQVLGTELVALGHRVTIVHVAGVERFVTDRRIAFAGIPSTAAAIDPLDAYLARLADPLGLPGLNRMIRATAAMTHRLLDGLPAILARERIDAVLADAAEPAGPLIAARMGLPHVASVTGLPLLREDDVPPPFLGWRYRPDALGRNRNRGGYAVSDLLLRPITRVLEDRRTAWRLAAPEPPRLHVAQCPRSLDYPRTEQPAGFLYSAPWRFPCGEAPDLPDDGRPLVFCSLGTLQGSRRELFATMAAACARIGARAVIGHGGGLAGADEAGLPGDPLVRAFWPQQAVLRRCSAAILHGGFNSVLDALAAGVPIVALPIAFEQPGTAARVAWTGAGRVLAPRSLTAARLAQALAAVIREPGYRRAARRLAVEMRDAGGAAQAAAAVSAALLAPS